jgi:hypothetical protein
MENFKVGQKVKYSNGSQSIYTGTIVKVDDSNYSLVVCDCEASLELFSLGFAVGSSIHIEQVVK